MSEVEDLPSRLRARGRSLMGFSADARPTPLFGDGSNPYPLLALGACALGTQLPLVGLILLRADIARSVGVRDGFVPVLLETWGVGLGIGAISMAMAIHRGISRARLAVGASVAGGCLTMVAALPGGSPVFWWPVLAPLGATAAAPWAVHLPLLMDAYRPSSRVRVIAMHRAAMGLAWVVGPAIIWGLSAAGLTWRGTFLCMGIVVLACAAGATRLTDAHLGSNDELPLREAVRAEVGGGSADGETGFDATISESARRLPLAPVARALIGCGGALGLVLFATPIYTNLYLDQRWNMTPGARQAFFIVAAVAAAVALWRMGSTGEPLLSRDPAGFVRLTRRVLMGGLASLGAAILVRSFMPMLVLLSAAFACLSWAAAGLTISLLSMLSGRLRLLAAAVLAPLLNPVGLNVLLDGFGRRYGVQGPLLFLLLPGAAAVHMLGRAAQRVDSQIDRIVADVVEDEVLRSLKSKRVHLPLLSCRRIDFFYGTVQTLFGVDLTVDDGEMVALLGTNGAGKSTLLRVVSGLGTPASGTVRLTGHDITFMDTRRRLRLGISHLEGGQTAFGPLTVTENLRLLGYSHGRNRAAVDRGLEATFEAFPKLEARRNQLAST
ncbi:MAG: ATP-binding cassette domain-containing protein, partial [Acidimicrobiales bacterium]